MNYRLSIPTRQDCIDISNWRNDVRESLRTPGFTGADQQYSFYESLISGKSRNRFYKILNKDNVMISFCGFTDISPENRTAEISMLVNPEYRRMGVGKTSLMILLAEGFGNLNLNAIVAECYECSPAIKFWEDMANSHDCESTYLPCRKYWNGKYHKSLFITFFNNKSIRK